MIFLYYEILPFSLQPPFPPPPVPLFRKYTVHVYVVADGSHTSLLNN